MPRPWRTPRTYSVTTRVSVTDRNVYERDNLNYLYHVPTAKCVADTEIGHQSVQPQTWTPLSNCIGSTSPAHDSGGLITGPARITVPETGKYWVQAQATWHDHATAAGKLIGIWKVAAEGDTLLVYSSQQNNANKGAGTNVVGTLSLTLGDVLEARVYNIVVAEVGAYLIRNASSYTPAEVSILRLRGADETA